jgi:phosphatidylinositol dimannoside acyltransferase
VTQVLQTDHPIATPLSWPERGRAACAAFWLSALFRLTAAAPALVWAVRPLFVRLAFLFSGKIRRNTDANARQIFGPLVSAKQRRDYGLGVVRSFYDFVCDIGRSLRQTREQLQSRIESAEGESEYHATRLAKKGAILLTAHMGSFEVGMVALTAHEKRIHVVFKRDQVGSFERLRTQLRKRLNVLEAPIDDGYAVWVALRSALLNDEVVAIQGDRVMPGQKGVAVPFLHGHLLLPTGPFKLALASGAPVIPIFSIRSSRGGINIHLEPAITVSNESDGIEQALRQFADCLAKYVARYPNQWLVLDKAFCDQSI